MASKLKQICQALVEEINRNPRIQEAVKHWISSYDGKVVGFRVSGSIERSEWQERFHLIIAPGWAKLGQGDYPSPDIVFLIENEQDGIEMLKNPLSAMELVKSGRIWIMANMNEGIQFFSCVVSHCSGLIRKLAG